jgi:hypothetical protein
MTAASKASHALVSSGTCVFYITNGGPTFARKRYRAEKADRDGVRSHPCLGVNLPRGRGNTNYQSLLRIRQARHLPLKRLRSQDHVISLLA